MALDSGFIILWPYCSCRYNDGGKNTKMVMAIHNVYNVYDDSNNGNGESNDYNGNVNDKSDGGCNDDIFGSWTLYLG